MFNLHMPWVSNTKLQIYRMNMLPPPSLLKTPDSNGFIDKLLPDCQGKDIDYVT